MTFSQFSLIRYNKTMRGGGRQRDCSQPMLIMGRLVGGLLFCEGGWIPPDHHSKYSPAIKNAPKCNCALNYKTKVYWGSRGLTRPPPTPISVPPTHSWCPSASLSLAKKPINKIDMNAVTHSYILNLVRTITHAALGVCYVNVTYFQFHLQVCSCRVVAIISVFRNWTIFKFFMFVL